jgi:methyl-accepting chemotaxis protein WspA
MGESKESILMRVISPFTYPKKFLFICCLFGFSIIVSSFFMIKAQNSSIDFIENELKGIQYEQPLKKLMHDITEHLLLLNSYQAGDSSLKNELINLQAKISSDFNFFLKMNHELQLNLNMGSRNLMPESLAEEWNELAKVAWTQNSDMSNRLHIKMLKEIRLLIDLVGDASNLNFDPTYECSYLVDVALSESIYNSELLVEVTSAGCSFIQQKKISSKDKYDLAGLITLLLNNTNTIQFGGEKLFKSFAVKSIDFDLENKLKDTSQILIENNEEFAAFIEKNFIQAEKLPSSSADLLALCRKTLAAQNNFWNAVTDELKQLLNKRLLGHQLEQRISILIILLGVVSGCVLGFLIMRQISEPLTNLVKATRRLSDGDLSARVPIISSDEVGEVGIAFNQMANSFQELIGQLQWTGIQLTTSTTEIAATAKQQETTIVEQEATTKEIAATARTISASAKEFAKTMSEVSSMAEQTSSLATSGKAGLTKMEMTMKQMVEAAENIASKLAVLNEKAGSITSIVTTISKVADQTHLLSLNAAIEAEKAGEYGRSFAVIAREIRRLADQTANATLDIEKMVTEMVSSVSAGVMGVDKFSEEINTGAKHVATVSEQLTKIIEQVQHQTTGFETVNQGMQNQSLGAEQINESINQLSEAAQQTTQSIRQFHNAIEQLNNVAQEMQIAVTKIKR